MMNYKFWCNLVFSLLVAICFQGCGLEDEVEEVKVDALKEWSWDAFRETDRLSYGLVSVRVASAKSHAFYAPTDTQLSLQLDGLTQDLSEGVVWGTLAADELELDLEILKNKESALELKQRYYESVELPNTMLDLEGKLLEARKRLKLFRTLEEVVEDELLRADFVQQYAADGSSGELEQLESRLSILEQQKALLLEAGGVKDLEMIRAQAELKEQFMKLDAKRRAHELKMPFDGRLSCRIDVLSFEGSQAVRSGTLLAVAEDMDALEAVVAVNHSSWLECSEEDRFVRLRLGQDVLDAAFLRASVGFDGQREQNYHHFKVIRDDALRLRNYANMHVPGELFVRLPKAMKVVPKFALLNHYPEVFADGDWEAGVLRLWPDVKLHAVGVTDLAIFASH